ncbi:hypothetical protein CRG98_002594 [Punica granatum]|uniref:Uncharacterized protein n=1 Tax=Punica granatum TaxID=22663 RepID=A0A2I0L8T3_PUNGR|nr:hypothetical protein CRG98_002594 [Punica granatum]
MAGGRATGRDGHTATTMAMEFVFPLHYYALGLTFFGARIGPGKLRKEHHPGPDPLSTFGKVMVSTNTWFVIRGSGKDPLTGEWVGSGHPVGGGRHRAVHVAEPQDIRKKRARREGESV